MATVIIAKNQTAGDLTLRLLSSPAAKIPASGQVTLTDYNTVSEIQEDEELLGYITSDDVLLNLNAVDLTKAQSLWVRESVTPKYNNTAAVAPTVNDDKDDGYSKGSVWVDTVTKDSYVCTDDSSGAAVWKESSAEGDVVGPSSAIDYGMAVFDGTTGKLIQDSGKRNYGGSATDPVSPAPADGDIYYNTVLDMWMVYDATRTKFLSIAETVIFFGKQGNTPAGSYYRGVGNLSYSAVDGKRAEFNGTIVSLEYTRSDSDSATFEVTAGGTGIATVASSAVAGGDITLNANFTANQILGVRNQTGGNATSDVHGSVRMRWRV
jgi:hypothetical protein